VELNTYQEKAMGTAVFKNRYSDSTITQAAIEVGISAHQAKQLIEVLFGNYPFELVYTVLAMCGECGELANKLKKNLRAGTQVNAEELMDENGDIQWYNAATARVLGYTFEEQGQFNLEKLRKRHEEKKVTG
jgi:NTP pyrophosphatase (non-canonical NTP hydrolase)